MLNIYTQSHTHNIITSTKSHNKIELILCNCSQNTLTVRRRREACGYTLRNATVASTVYITSFQSAKEIPFTQKHWQTIYAHMFTALHNLWKIVIACSDWYRRVVLIKQQNYTLRIVLEHIPQTGLQQICMCVRVCKSYAPIMDN